MKRQITFLQFRSNALQALALIKIKNRTHKQTKDDLERWVKKEWNRHYGKVQ